MAVAITKIGVTHPPSNDARRTIVFLFIPIFPLAGSVEQQLDLFAGKPSEDCNA